MRSSKKEEGVIDSSRHLSFIRGILLNFHISTTDVKTFHLSFFSLNVFIVLS